MPRLQRGRCGALAIFIATLGGCCCVSTTPISRSLVGDPTFPGPGDFEDGYGYDVAPKEVRNGLQSTYDGTIVVTMIDDRFIETLLPQNMRLAPPLSATGKHPVIHLIGDQREPRIVGLGIPGFSLSDVGYREMILLIPFVVRGAGKQWHNYAVRMYLDDQIAVNGGNVFFGYAKVKAELGKQETSNRITHQIKGQDTFVGTTYFLSDVQITGHWTSAASNSSSTPPRWADLREIFEMPVLGVSDKDGSLVCSYWEWYFEDAKVAPAKSEHRVVTSFRPGMEDWPHMGPQSNGKLSNAPGGAVAVRGIRWRLGAPLGWPSHTSAGCRFD